MVTSSLIRACQTAVLLAPVLASCSAGSPAVAAHTVGFHTVAATPAIPGVSAVGPALGIGTAFVGFAVALEVCLDNYGHGFWPPHDPHVVRVEGCEKPGS